ncbi:2-succinyl-5-enolpyruvyl-6-hydroxy-3-cyclohexene-1-carboxylic-acid synthase [Cellulomonas carbonis]|uniref:2-succinyl-5-enolpyruvyl-6-hydroxy-3-cyclohexene-1-carboxylate synthase n=1 Tax=Cellulomonas carbonis T26 TaxID=947969 RepID=A0A0A0BSK3_9CELL|nr:2-succinyl-5-enolpyruvyl-6-hydroxy-3-cyclohexene-1-carboxylic-acid synthase [Cellulomonas carbonis]KGM11423.1 2-succinyl-6-hydroxy-2,4-cyclohexadiene-1-carboxylate synthase [Cellulomonas carbonis T26]GGC09278.1 2-succinyl-5-enolpyruvyl-6-hydroxy-3-cyclohexene-1-carboxylate synthase [Cellulomonas carbonis]
MSASTRAARVLLQALAALGVHDVVLSPGSRSAPLAYALAEAAAHREGGARSGAPGDDARAPGVPRLDLHVRVDERSAGFLALGLARGARLAGDPRPVAVVTTSGTAVANLHPAVLEAHHSGVPLLLLTADRPHELRGTGANQTTEQVGLLEPVRLTIDVPAPTGRPGEDRDLRHVAARAVAFATGARTGDPGPVHVNLAFRDPLVPDDEPWPEPSRDGLAEVLRRGAAVGGVASGAPHPTAALTAAPLTTAPDASLPGDLEPDGVPTVVVAGDEAGPLARRLAEANGWPLLAEPSSGARGGPNAVAAYRLLLADTELGGAVRRAVVLGRPTLSRPVQALLARPDVESLVVAPHGGDWPDASRNATQVLAEVPPGLLRGRLGEGAVTPSGRPWLEAWRTAGAAALGAVRAVGAEENPAPAATGEGLGGLSGLAVAAEVAASVGPDDVLVVGSSNPVRDLDLVAAWDEPPAVVANRGLAGIDGTVSTAGGVALALGRPVVALLGDLTFLHEVGGLLVGPLEREPDVRLVVANDDGGSIFATLEHGEPARAATFERVFGTPHDADLGALCAGYGVPHQRLTTLEELRSALAARVAGRSVVEVVVDRAGRRDLHAAVAAAVQEAVRGDARGPDGVRQARTQD